MHLQHSFTVPADIDRAWQVLLDIERIAPCMPGAALDSVDGDDFTGSVKVRLGPIGLTYKGKASFVEKDAAGHRAVIDAQGKDARGNGTAKAVITATLTAAGSGTAVNVVTDLKITGKPAQFGRGVMVDVGNKLVGQFADCLAGKLSEPDEGAAATAPVPYLTESTVSEPAGEPLPPTIIEPDMPADAVPEAVLAVVPETPPDAVAVEPEAAAEQAPPAQRLAEVTAASTGDGSAQPAGDLSTVPPRRSQRPSQRPSPAELEPIDLLGSAGPALAKRLGPIVAGVLLIVVLFRRRRRH